MYFLFKFLYLIGFVWLEKWSFVWFSGCVNLIVCSNIGVKNVNGLVKCVVFVILILRINVLCFGVFVLLELVDVVEICF